VLAGLARGRTLHFARNEIAPRAGRILKVASDFTRRSRPEHTRFVADSPLCPPLAPGWPQAALLTRRQAHTILGQGHVPLLHRVDELQRYADPGRRYCELGLWHELARSKSPDGLDIGAELVRRAVRIRAHPLRQRSRLGHSPLLSKCRHVKVAHRFLHHRPTAGLFIPHRTIQAAGVASLHGVADALNACGIHTARGGKWYTATVRNMLMRQELA